MEDTKFSNPFTHGFSGPANNEKRSHKENTIEDSIPEQSTPTDEISPPVQKRAMFDNALQSKESTKKVASVEKKKTTQEIYIENLDEHGITKETARLILDCIFCQNCYKESGTLANRVSYTLRTRQSVDLDRVLHHLEDRTPRMAMTSQDIIARYNLAASLAKYNNTEFDFPVVGVDGATVDDVESAFEKRLNFIKNLASPILEKLIQRVSDFDRKVLVVTADGAPEDF